MNWLKKGWYYILPILALILSLMSDQKIDKSLVMIVAGVLLLMILMDISKYRILQEKRKKEAEQQTSTIAQESTNKKKR
ncbi:hypothetical protein [Brochothrix campestris]|uniref:Uncharacterized protein n=1 Tax=Brochothrix campestris FSL F6-1037 TaxID=1265861 RepID=W7CKL7_9LIST|nr:hypothetical protein [Brochothrix campestris]EUJ39989.1 hypothetical protein BCAMP_06055 [Brochothrix campestris FSL F6-1037]